MEYAKKGTMPALEKTVLWLFQRDISKTHLFDLPKADELRVVKTYFEHCS